LARDPLGAAASGAGARRFAARLREKLRDQTPDAWREFTTTEAKNLNVVSRRTVDSFLIELNNAGVIEQVEPSKGRIPARWKLAAEGRVPGVLPTADAVRAECEGAREGCPREHNT
jgi:hypothetical protein